MFLTTGLGHYHRGMCPSDCLYYLRSMHPWLQSFLLFWHRSPMAQFWGGGGMSIISLRLRTMEEGADRAGRWETGSRPHNLSLETLAQRQGCKHQHIECQTTTKWESCYHVLQVMGMLPYSSSLLEGWFILPPLALASSDKTQSRLVSQNSYPCHPPLCKLTNWRTGVILSAVGTITIWRQCLHEFIYI